MHHNGHARLLCPLDHGFGVLGTLDASEPDLPHRAHAFPGHFNKVLLGQALFQDHRAAYNLGPARPEVVVGLGCEDSQGFRARRILGSTLEVNFAG